MALQDKIRTLQHLLWPWICYWKSSNKQRTQRLQSCSRSAFSLGRCTETRIPHTQVLCHSPFPRVSEFDCWYSWSTAHATGIHRNSISWLLLMSLPRCIHQKPGLKSHLLELKFVVLKTMETISPFLLLVSFYWSVEKKFQPYHYGFVPSHQRPGWTPRKAAYTLLPTSR